VLTVLLRVYVDSGTNARLIFRAVWRMVVPAKKKAAKKRSSNRAKTVTSKRATKKKVAMAKKKAPPKKKVSKKKAPATKKKARRPVAKKPSKKKAASKKKPAKKKPAVKKAAAKKSVTKKSATAKKKPSAKSRKKTPRRERGSAAAGYSDFSPYQRQRDEDYMNTEQTDHFRDILQGWRRELMEEVDRTVHHMQDDASNFPDPNDRATQEEEFALELRTRDRERKLIKKINESLAALDSGEYGYCEICGVDIGIQRLEARPTATLCIDCKTLDEIRERQHV